VDTTDKNSPNGHSTVNPADVKSPAGDEQDGSQNEAHSRTDTNRLHALKHRILSRNLLEAMVERGESLREWRDLIRELRDELQVKGPLAGLYFDRLCAAMMREALISTAERAIFIATDEASSFEARLKQANMVAMATNSTNVDGPQAVNLLRYLPTLQRYASYYRKEFDRDLGALLAFRDGGPKALAQFLNRTGRHNKDNSRDSND
jgi:hypothetical protein